MAKPYWLVAYGHALRVSERCDTAREAHRFCFGVDDGGTAMRIDGKAWAYRSASQPYGLRRMND